MATTASRGQQCNMFHSSSCKPFLKISVWTLTLSEPTALLPYPVEAAVIRCYESHPKWQDSDRTRALNTSRGLWDEKHTKLLTNWKRALSDPEIQIHPKEKKKKSICSHVRPHSARKITGVLISMHACFPAWYILDLSKMLQEISCNNRLNKATPFWMKGHLFQAKHRKAYFPDNLTDYS